VGSSPIPCFSAFIRGLLANGARAKTATTEAEEKKKGIGIKGWIKGPADE